MTDALSAVDARAEAVAKAPDRRISKKYIEDRIVGKHFMDGGTFVVATGTYEGGPTPKDAEAYAHLTICMLKVGNGFIVLGESAPMEPTNFNAELGQQLAYEDAFRKLWPLYAFARLEDELLYGRDEGPDEPSDATNDKPAGGPPQEEKE